MSDTLDNGTIVPNGLDIMGALYNCLSSPYAEKKYAGQVVVTGISDAPFTSQEVGDYEYAYPQVLSGRAYSQTFENETLAYSYSEFTEKLAEKAGISGSTGLFSGSVTTNLSVSESQINESLFVTFFDSKPLLETFFNTSDINTGEDSSNSASLGLDEDFWKALNNKSIGPGDFFEDWGTHIIKGIVIGGQVRYSTYASQSVYSDTSQFSIDAKAKYAGLSGSGQVDFDESNVSSNYEKNIESGTSLDVIGGSTDTQLDVGDGDTDKFEAWYDTIEENPDFIDFDYNGLLPVWELCTDDDRKDELSAYFDGRFTSNLKVADKMAVAENEGTYLGDNDDKRTEIYADLESEGLETWASNQSVTLSCSCSSDYEVITGFGVTISSGSHHVARIKVRILNFITGQYRYAFDGNNPNNSYEVYAEAPTEAAMTGIGMSATNGNANDLIIINQDIKTDKSSDNYLDLAFNDPAHSPASSTSESFQVFYNPSVPNYQVITGIAVTASSEKQKFTKLAVEVGTLTEAD